MSVKMSVMLVLSLVTTLLICLAIMDVFDPQPNDQTSVTLSEGDLKIEVSIEEGNALKKLLIKHISDSDLGDKELLLGRINALPVWIEPDNVMNVAGWRLSMEKGQTKLMTIISSSPERSVGYVAEFCKVEDEWQFLKLVPYRRTNR